MLINYFNGLLNIGADSGEHQFSKEMFRLLNLICLLSAVGAITMSLLSAFVFHDNLYAKLAFFVSIPYILILLGHFFKKFNLGWTIFSILTPVTFSTTSILIGGDFAQGLAIVVTAVITYFLHRKKTTKRNFLIAYSGIIYLMSALYVGIYGPILGVHNYPYDEIIVFTLCFFWLVMALALHNDEMQSIINSLKKRNIELDRKSKELERFSYVASHDLKSPLQNIINFISLIKKETAPYNNPKLEKYIEIAETGSYQMNELIEGVLEVSNINKIRKSEYKKVDLNSIIDKVVFNLKNEINKKNAEINVKDLPEYVCYEADFIIIFQNLLQNGLKYNDKEIPR
ncbi:MAG: histidine kinase dimerization/phospho-acceptor domain-containing protein, partial [Bacteroidota bacterium]